MPLIRASQLEYQVGSQILLDQAEIQLAKSERVCLLGRNGAGKSTLLRILAGQVQADAGEIWRAPGLRVAVMEQQLPDGRGDETVYDAVAGGLQELGQLLQQYHNLATSSTPDMQRLEHLQHEIEAREGWHFQQKIDKVLSRLELLPDARLSELSGGWLRRVSLARALVCEPDLLFLDEPTNHLDVQSIEWLEAELRDFTGAVFFITHDRRLIEDLATRIVELDRGHLNSYEVGYQRYLELREQALEVEERHNALFDKKLAEEESWIRQGIKARRTRNEGRVRALLQLREQRAARRERQGTARMSISSGESSGKLVAELQGVSYSVAGKRLITDFNLIIQRGDRLALVGPNGCGKSTLLKLILGELEPDAGVIRRGSRQQIAYFDQMRNRLDEDASVSDIVGEGRESIRVGGRERHIVSYLGDFLFTPERARSPLRVLSGGERARVQLACLFSQPANILVLDEPTNDLDIETLELLESLVADFDGTVLLVSHDRAFVDNVVTSCLVFEGDGRIVESVGGYSDIRWPDKQQKLQQAVSVAPKTKPKARAESRSGKLSYKDKRELELLPEKIEQLEQQLEALQQETAARDFYSQDHEAVSAKMSELAAIQGQLDESLERWMELSDAE